MYKRQGESPFFALADGLIVECEVHGRVPYVRVGVPAMPMIVAMPGDENGGAMPHEDAPVAMPPPAPVEAAAPEAKPERDLKAEAVSIAHLMTHTPKNPLRSVPAVEGATKTLQT